MRAKSTKKLDNLFKALADGFVEPSETFKATVKAAEADVERLANLIATQERILTQGLKTVSLEEAEVFSEQFRSKLLSSAPALKRRIVRSFVRNVVVSSDEIVIVGAKSDLAEVVTGSI